MRLVVLATRRHLNIVKTSTSNQWQRILKVLTVIPSRPLGIRGAQAARHLRTKFFLNPLNAKDRVQPLRGGTGRINVPMKGVKNELAPSAEGARKEHTLHSAGPSLRPRRFAARFQHSLLSRGRVSSAPTSPSALGP